ncbi:hypothetical protein [Amycolatopsis thailandensis]|uniref:hypothetical protein n=1 Tax=Amycolatopsis thailandensis TaxID=589330 RepID=UPI00362FB295
MAVAAAAAVLAGGGAAGIGALGGASAPGGAGAAAEALAGNTGGVVDSLPGRSLKVRRAEGRESAKRGRTDEALSRLRFKQLKRKAERELNCVASASGRVREFLIKTPCTSMERMLLAVGDGQGSAAVVSVVRVGFKTKKDAEAFKRVEDVHGSGDVRPLDIAAVLGVAGVKMTGLHYHARPDKNAIVVAEADTARGRVDRETLEALADVGSYLPTS